MEPYQFFTTPIWKEDLFEFVKPLTKLTDPYIKEARKRNKPLIKNLNDFGFSHHSSTLTKDENFKKFHDYVGKKSLDFLDYSGFDMSEYVVFFSESWVQEFSKNGGGHHSAHIHHNTHVNGFYFLKANENTSYPVFHDPRSGARSTKLKLKTEDFNSGLDTVHVKPVPGTLVLFPGYLEHEFTVDHGKSAFRFIHFTIQAIPKQMSKYYE